MNTNKLDTWTGDDYYHNLCRADQVGTAKPEIPVSKELSSEKVLAELPPATMGEFKQAVLNHFRGFYGSYEAFLAANPDFARKFMLSMVREPTIPGPAVPLQVIVSWISPDRFAYKRADTSPPPVEMVTDVVVRETPWKKPLDTSANRLVDDIDKLGS